IVLTFFKKSNHDDVVTKKKRPKLKFKSDGGCTDDVDGLRIPPRFTVLKTVSLLLNKTMVT
ncbi:predicted protein, partial [Arabidopsis lyrata subsp. lyrata]